MNDTLSKIIAVLGVITMTLLIGLILIYPTMLLWNYVMPTFDLPELGFWQTAALYFLTRIFINPIQINKD